MHRYVWLKERGPIPEKYHVHHIDGDKSNNKIENLTLLHTSEHAKLHAKEYIENNREKFNKHLDNIRPLAAIAHKKQENRHLKSQRLKFNFDNNEKIKSKCKNCGIEIEFTKGFKRKVFCGKRCASSTEVRKNKKNQRERERYRLLHESKK